MCQKEKTSTFSRTCTTFKYLIAVQMRAEGMFKHLQIYRVAVEEFAELIQLVVRHFCLCVNDSLMWLCLSLWIFQLIFIIECKIAHISRVFTYWGNQRRMGLFRNLTLHGNMIWRRRTSSHHFIPLFYVFYVDLSNCYCGVSMAIDSILHSLERLYLLLRELVFHEVEQRELANAIQDRVDHLQVKRRTQKKHKRLYFFFPSFCLDAILFLGNFLCQLIDLLLAG